MSEKSKTNKKWTSTEASRANYDRIFGKKCKTCGGHGEVVIFQGNPPEPFGTESCNECVDPFIKETPR